MDSILLPPAPNWYASQSCDFSQDGRLFAYAASDSVVVLDMFSRPPSIHAHLTDGHAGGKILSLSFTRAHGATGDPATGYLLLTGGSDKQMVLWNAMTARKIRATLRHGEGGVTALACLASDAPDSATCVAADLNGRFVAWNFGSQGAPINLQRSQRQERMAVTCMVDVAPLPGHVLVGCRGGWVHLVDVSSMRECVVVTSWEAHSQTDVQGLTYHCERPPGRSAAALPELLVASGAEGDPQAKCRVFRLAAGSDGQCLTATPFCHINVTKPPSSAVPDPQRTRLFVTPQFLPAGALDGLGALDALVNGHTGAVLCLTGYAGALHVYLLATRPRQPPVASLKLPGQHTRNVFSINFPPQFAPAPAPLPLVTTSLDRSILLWSLPRGPPSAQGSEASSLRDTSSSRASSPRGSVSGEQDHSATAGEPAAPFTSTSDSLAENALRPLLTPAWSVDKALRAAGPSSTSTAPVRPSKPLDGPPFLKRLVSKATVQWSVGCLGGYPLALDMIRGAPCNRLVVASGDSTLRILPLTAAPAPTSKVQGPRAQSLWTGSDAKAQATAVSVCPACAEVVACGLGDGTVALVHTPTQGILTFSTRSEGEVTSLGWLNLGTASQTSPSIFAGWALCSLSARGALSLWCPAQADNFLQHPSAGTPTAKKLIISSQLPPVDIAGVLLSDSPSARPTALAISSDARTLVVGLSTGLVLALIPAPSSHESYLRTATRHPTAAAAAPSDPLAVMVLEGGRSAAQPSTVLIDARAFRVFAESAISSAATARFQGAPAAVTLLSLGLASETCAYVFGSWSGRGLGVLALERESDGPRLELLHHEADADAPVRCASTIMTWRPECFGSCPSGGRKTGSKAACFLWTTASHRLRSLELFRAEGTGEHVAQRLEASAPIGHRAPVRSIVCNATKTKLTVITGGEDAALRSVDILLKDLLTRSGTQPRAPADAFAASDSQATAASSASAPDSAGSVTASLGEWAQKKVLSTADKGGVERPSQPASQPAVILGRTPLIPERSFVRGGGAGAESGAKLRLLHSIVRLARLKAQRSQLQRGDLDLARFAQLAALEEKNLQEVPGDLPLASALALAASPAEACAALLHEVDRLEEQLAKLTGLAKVRLAVRLAVFSVWAGDTARAVDLLLQHRALSADLAAALLPILELRVEPQDLPALQSVTRRDEMIARGEPHAAAFWALVRNQRPRDAIQILLDVGSLDRDAHALARARLLPSDPLVIEAAQRVERQVQESAAMTASLEDRVACAVACGDWLGAVQLLGGLRGVVTSSASLACALEVARVLCAEGPEMDATARVLEVSPAARECMWPPVINVASAAVAADCMVSKVEVPEAQKSTSTNLKKRYTIRELEGIRDALMIGLDSGAETANWTGQVQALALGLTMEEGVRERLDKMGFWR